MVKKSHHLILRPGITNPNLWYPERPPKSEWDRIRGVVMERDDWTCAFCHHRAIKWMNTHHVKDSADHDPKNLVPVCVACHAVLHVGNSLRHGSVEIWKCDMAQIEVVRYTRLRVRQGISLSEIKKQLSISPGPYAPDDVEYANDLIRNMGDAPRAYLDEPLCAIFTNLKRWQIEAD